MSALRRIRVDANLSIDELARAAHVSPEQIRNIEAGRVQRPRAATLTKLADALSANGEPVRASDIDPVLEHSA